MRNPSRKTVTQGYVSIRSAGSHVNRRTVTNADTSACFSLNDSKNKQQQSKGALCPLITFSKDSNQELLLCVVSTTLLNTGIRE